MSIRPTACPLPLENSPWGEGKSALGGRDICHESSECLPYPYGNASLLACQILRRVVGTSPVNHGRQCCSDRQYNCCARRTQSRARLAMLSRSQQSPLHQLQGQSYNIGKRLLWVMVAACGFLWASSLSLN